jgi:hypothetical protein
LAHLQPAEHHQQLNTSQSGETSQTSPLTTQHHQQLEKYKAVGPKQAQAPPQKGQKEPSLPPTLLEETRQNQKAAKPKKQRQKISFRSTIHPKDFYQRKTGIKSF